MELKIKATPHQVLRWGHVFLIYVMVALAYSSSSLVDRPTLYTVLRCLIGGVFAYLVVDLICGYFAKKLLNDLDNYDSLDEMRKKLIQEVFFKKFVKDIRNTQHLNTSEKQAMKKFFQNMIDRDPYLDDKKKKVLYDIMKELNK
jgi:hypothetical protein